MYVPLLELHSYECLQQYSTQISGSNHLFSCNYYIQKSSSNNLFDM